MGQLPEVEYSASRAGGQEEYVAFYQACLENYDNLQQAYMAAEQEDKDKICAAFNGEDISLGAWKLDSTW